jgi:hypothetical protein
MPGVGSLYETARAQTRERLAEIRRRHGCCAAGVVAEGWLEGIRDELLNLVGPEATYGTFQRKADRSAEPLLLSQANNILKG